MAKEKRLAIIHTDGLPDIHGRWIPGLGDQMSKGKYPENWREISAALIDAAGRKCTDCGAIGGQEGWRLESGFIPEGRMDLATDDELAEIVRRKANGEKPIKIVMNVHHLDENPANSDPENLVVLCKGCHIQRHNKPRTRWSKAEMTPGRKVDPEQITIDTLQGWEHNPRRIKPEALEALRKSMDRFGDLSGIVFNLQTGRLVTGHQRIKGLREQYPDLEFDRQLQALITGTGHTFPVRFVDWHPDLELAANIAANNPALQGVYLDTVEEMVAHLEAAQPGLVEDLLLEQVKAEAFLKDELEQPEPKDPDDAPPAPPKAKTSIGDVWIMGRHRLACADATNPEAFEILMPGQKADLIFTDPPYNVDYAGGTTAEAAGKDRRIMNDNLGEGFEAFLLDFCEAALPRTAGAAYICISSSEIDTLKRAFTAAGGHWSTFIIWAKDRFTLGRSDYHRQYEPILYGYTEDTAPVIQPLPDPKKKPDGPQKQYESQYQAMLYGWPEGNKRFWRGDRTQGDVWYCRRPSKNALHPTQKPVELVVRAIFNSTRRGGTVLDPFAGSGTTLIAAEMTGRQARLLELDPKFADVIVQRWQDFTGGKAVREGDNLAFDEAEERTQDGQDS